MVQYKKTLNFLADVILAGNPITAVKELVKAAVDQLDEGRFWEQLYLDAFHNAVNQMKDELRHYADQDGEISLDEDALRKALSHDIHVSLDNMTSFDLEKPEFLLALTEALSKRNALIIGGHKLDTRTHLKNGRLRSNLSLGVDRWISKTNNGQWSNLYFRKWNAERMARDVREWTTVRS